MIVAFIFTVAFREQTPFTITHCFTHSPPFNVFISSKVEHSLQIFLLHFKQSYTVTRLQLLQNPSDLRDNEADILKNFTKYAQICRERLHSGNRNYLQ